MYFDGQGIQILPCGKIHGGGGGGGWRGEWGGGYRLAHGLGRREEERRGGCQRSAVCVSCESIQSNKPKKEGEVVAKGRLFL